MKKNWLLLVLLIASPVLYFSCSKSSTTTTLVGNWSQISELKGVARSGAVCFTIGDLVYVGLGYNSTNTPKYLLDFYKYDYKTNQWTAIKSFPDAAKGRIGAVAFSANGRGYVGTGYDGENYRNDFWEYDPTADNWRRVKTLCDFGRRNAVAFSIGNNGYVGTGYSGNYLGDFWKYTPSAADSGSWEAIADMPYKRANGAAFVINNIGYVVTGDNNGSYTDRFFSYDPSAQVWTELKRIANVSTETYDDSYNITRSNPVAFVANGKGYITCGATSGVRSDTWEFDPTNDLWSQKTSFEGTARSEAVGFSINNRLFVAAGKNGSYVFDDVWEFKPDDTYDANN